MVAKSGLRPICGLAARILRPTWSTLAEISLGAGAKLTCRTGSTGAALPNGLVATVAVFSLEDTQPSAKPNITTGNRIRFMTGPRQEMVKGGEQYRSESGLSREISRPIKKVLDFGEFVAPPPPHTPPR